MSRTATHLRKRYHRSQDALLPLEFTVFDLRSPRCAAARPEHVRRRVRYDQLVNVWGRDGVALASRQDERRARATVRVALVQLIQAVNGAEGLAAAEDLDIAPYRPRHNALWQAI